ncbi:WXG100 family type VII secretion target [Nocardia sp. CA-128927]|uniref:WXG100 family type VII secretion target n=1 Tax=Nocardia sp. CA-128927 TaxID=3239975 RepID=UPI003D96D543
MSNLWADPDRLRAVTPQFEQLGQDVNTALEKLKQGIESEGHCWGKDKPGQQFEKNYPQGDGDGSVGQHLTALAKLADALKSTGERITVTANGLQARDEHNADQIRQV